MSTLEETAKLAVERFRVAGVVSGTPIAKGRKGPMYQHRAKHLLAVMQGALINNRVDRLLGVEEVNDFLGLVERGELERLRHACLYADPGTNGPSIPRSAVSRERSAWIVAFAGEVLAETHLGPEQWGRFIGKVDAFEVAAGLQPAPTEAD